MTTATLTPALIFQLLIQVFILGNMILMQQAKMTKFWLFVLFALAGTFDLILPILRLLIGV